jgi:Cdc6-like AAA superfamily ATPase
LRFLSHWDSLTEEQRLKEFKDERLYKVACQEVATIASQGDARKVTEGLLAKAQTSIEHVNEYIKLKTKVLKSSEAAESFEELGVQVLGKDPRI